MLIKSIDMVLYFLTGLLLVSCVQQQAVIDQSAMGKILWPGPPEKPRIQYLWSVSLISGGQGSGLYTLFAGEETDLTDPKNASRLLRPYSLYYDETGILYIADPGAFRATIINTKTGDSMNILKAGPDDLRSPVGIAAFRGNVYISDSLLKKVFIFDIDGSFLGELQGPFLRPTALAVDQDRGILYVSDTLAHVIYIFTADGKRQGTIGRHGSGEGEFNFPTHLWVDRAGRLYVTDAMNFRVQIFSSDGSFHDLFGTLGDAYGHLEKPKGVATDSDGNIYVVDSIKDTVKIFNREGKLLLFFGNKGRNYGQFWLPSGIFIDGKNHIYVADTYNGRIQAFRYVGGEL